MPASWRTSDLTVLLVAGAGTVLLTAASFMVAPPDTLPRNDGSSYAAHPDGARAAFLLLKELGYHVDRSFEPVTAIRHAPEHTALVLANPSEAPSAQDVQALQTFVERGGLVLATGPVAAAFLPGVPQKTQRRNDAAALRASRARRQDRALPAALTDGVESVDMPSATAPLGARLAVRRDLRDRSGSGGGNRALRVRPRRMVGRFGAARQWRDRPSAARRAPGEHTRATRRADDPLG